MNPIITLNAPCPVNIIKRPSAYCKTPYVADITINDQPFMAHCPALGCCGLSDKGSKVIVSPIKDKKEASKCNYRVELAIVEERGHQMIVGINPKLAEKIMYRLLETNLCPFLQPLSFEREKTFLNSRFDFAGIDQDERPFIMEIKNVPLADYVDVPKKERKQYNTDDIPYHKKIAYFPDGYRKNSTDVVSPRALKHIKELQEICIQTQNKTRAILCFVIQRTDAEVFQPSNIDLTYKAAVQEAVIAGVEVRAIQCEWNVEGQCIFKKELAVRVQ